MTTPILGDLPDWSRVTVNEAPQLIADISLVPVASPYVANVDVPSNAVMLIVGISSANVSAVKIVGVTSQIVYMDVSEGLLGVNGYLSSTVLAVTDTQVTVSISYTGSLGIRVRLYASTFGLPVVPSTSFVENTTPTPSVAYGFVHLNGVSINPSTPLTFYQSIPAPSANETITVLAVVLSIATTASDGQAAVSVGIQSGSGGTPSAYAAICPSRVSTQNIVNLTPMWQLQESSSPLLPGIYYMNSGSASVEVSASIYYMTVTG